MLIIDPKLFEVLCNILFKLNTVNSILQQRLEHYGFEKRYKGPIGSPEEAVVEKENGEIESASGEKTFTAISKKIVICNNQYRERKELWVD